MGPKSITSVLLRDSKGEDMDTQREEGHVNTEVEIGVKQPQAKAHPEPPEAGKGEEAFSSGAFRHLDFRRPASRTVRE